jgi:hypothetical protein
MRARSDSDVSSSTGFLCCAFTRRAPARVLASRRDNAKEYLRQIFDLDENYIRAELAHLTELEAYLLQTFYKSGLRGTHIRHLKKDDLFDTMMEVFLYPGGMLDINFESYIKQMMDKLSADNKHQAFRYLLGVCHQHPDKLMERVRIGVLEYKNSIMDMFALFQGMSELDAASLPEASYAKPTIRRVPMVENLQQLGNDEQLSSYTI